MKKKYLILAACICMCFGMTQTVHAVTETEETEIVSEVNEETDQEVETEVVETEEVVLEEEDSSEGEVKAQEIEEAVWRWDHTEDGWLYNNGLEYETGLFVNGDNTYYLNEETGYLQTGFQIIDDELYYFNEEGETPEDGLGTLVTNSWIQIEDIGTVYVGEDGRIVTGWQKIDSEIYYFSEEEDTEGLMVTGQAVIGDYTYFFDEETGAMHTGWLKVGKSTYYYKKTGTVGLSKGSMFTGWQTISSKYFYFNDAGKMLSGWETIDGKIFYFKKSGSLGTKGQMMTGKSKISNKYYYFRKTGSLGTKGQMMTGFREIGNKTYYFKKTGKLGTTKGQMFTGWQQISKKWYYFSSTGVMQTGWLKDDGEWYYLGNDGKMLTGWHYLKASKGARYDSYKFYFKSDGSLMQDVSSKIGRQSSYYAEVDRTNCTVVIYAKDDSGEYRIPVKTLTCSVGLPGTPTPTGTFHTLAKYRWRELMGPSWGQYATRIVGGVLFHSVAGSAPNSYALPAAEYNKLGQPASHGCVRLNVRDAKWIYDNCSLGMTVKIGDKLYQPFDKPESVRIPGTQNWDPTDPAI